MLYNHSSFNPANSSGALKSVETGPDDFKDLTSPTRAVQQQNFPKTSHTVRWEEHKRLAEIKRTLRDGIFEKNGQKTTPFVFHLENGEHIPAETPGLEGFIFTERSIASTYGEQASARLLSNYILHAKTLLGSVNREVPVQKISEIESKSLPPLEKYREFIGYLRSYVDELRHEVHSLDPALFSHSAREYQIFVRAFNLPGWRKQFVPSETAISGKFFADFNDSDFKAIADQSFKVIRLMGVYPIGKVHAKGDGGGSPFAVQKYEVDPRYGSAEDVRNFVARAEKFGISVMFELVPNHTAVDADLLFIDPRLYVHTREQPKDLNGYYHFKSAEHGEFWIRHGGYFNSEKNRREYWTDTLQLDFSNPDTRDFIIAQAKDLVRNYGIKLLRVDSAYQMLNRYLSKNWGDEMEQKLPQREFLHRMITEIKTDVPGIAFAAEAFDGWDELSECGFDLIYGINDMTRRGGHLHQGWNDAIDSRNPERIRAAIRRAEFLRWQEGGADMITFVGQHDRPAPWKKLGTWLHGATELTIMKPGALSEYAGTDALFDAPCSEDGKMITFNSPVQIDWSLAKVDPFPKFIGDRLKRFARYQEKYGEMEFHCLYPSDGNRDWVGYFIQKVGADPLDEKILVIANPTDHDIRFSIDVPEYGIHIRDISLEKCGTHCSEIIEYPSQKEIQQLKLSA